MQKPKSSTPQNKNSSPKAEPRESVGKVEGENPSPEVKPYESTGESEGGAAPEAEETEEDEESEEDEEDEEDKEDPLYVGDVDAGEFGELQKKYPNLAYYDGYKKWPTGFLLFRRKLLLEKNEVFRKEGRHLDMNDWNIDFLMESLMRVNLELFERGLL